MHNCYVRFVKTCTFDGLYKVHHVAIAPASLQYHQERYNVAFVLWCKYINPLTSNDPYRGRTASLTSKRCIFYIYSTNIGTEYFKHGTGLCRNNSHILKGNKNQTKQGTQKILLLIKSTYNAVF
jgi:hypothetical protein